MILKTHIGFLRATILGSLWAFFRASVTPSANSSIPGSKNLRIKTIAKSKKQLAKKKTSEIPKPHPFYILPFLHVRNRAASSTVWDRAEKTFPRNPFGFLQKGSEDPQLRGTRKTFSARGKSWGSGEIQSGSRILR